MTIPSAAVASLCLLACSLAGAQPKTPPASEKDWQDALAAIRKIALDTTEAETHRAHAVTAYAKLLLRKKRLDEAAKFCRQVLKGAAKTAVLDAALRAGCLVERSRCGYLRAERDYLASWSGGAHQRVASTIARELQRTVQTLASLAARKMVPTAVVPRLPHWAAARPERGPSALHVTHPRMQAPPWYRTLRFPPLKDPARGKPRR